MPFEQRPGRLVLEPRAARDRFDDVGEFELRDLQRQLEIARRHAEHFGQLDLPGMQVEPAQAAGQDVAR